MSQAPASDDIVQAMLEARAEAGRSSCVPIAGTSMCPLLRPGDIVEVVFGRARPRVGQILVYQAGDQVIVHRLICRRGNGILLLAGDSRRQADPPVPREAVIGRAISVGGDGRMLSVETRTARAAGWAVAASFPLRRLRLLHAPLAWLANLAAWLVRGRAD